METLLYFIVFAGLFFLMMRFGCGSHVTGHGHGDHEGHEGHGGGESRGGSGARWVPPESEVDPVCSMTVRTDSAKSAAYGGRVYYFCSAEHREQFEAAPDRYIGVKVGPEPKPMEGSHG